MAVPALAAVLHDQHSAIAASYLGSIPGDMLARLLADSVRVRVPAGEAIHYEGEAVPHVDLVLAGLVRVFVSAPDGRTMTVRYCRRGSLMGVVSVFAPHYSMPAGSQAIVDSQLLLLRPDLVRRYAACDIQVAQAMIGELSERVLSFKAELAGAAFGTVRQRVSRHLLDLASDHQRGAELIAPISQHELADAVGTVREVVVRTLRELRHEGVVRTGREGIVIEAPERLLSDAHPGLDISCRGT